MLGSSWSEMDIFYKTLVKTNYVETAKKVQKYECCKIVNLMLRALLRESKTEKVRGETV